MYVVHVNRITMHSNDVTGRLVPGLLVRSSIVELQTDAYRINEFIDRMCRYT